MPGARATTAHPWSPSQQHMPGAEAATEHAWSSTQQAAPGVVLNRANWHPNDHPLPLFIVYWQLLYSPLFKASTILA
ncbi:MAG TPA: hypothetical protein DDW33_11540 [Ktedonobacter sp.]|jgi:hypothetical protein|nr:hypothetical protein [Ktedonobacter sp.]